MNKHYGYIYKTTNLLDDKIYIGQRKGNFDTDYFGSGIYLKNAISKYGKDKFKLEVIIYTKDKNKLNNLEKKYISEYRKIFGKENLYNIAEGGEGGGKPHSEETKRKMRLAYKHKENCVCIVCKPRKGKDHPLFGRNISPETREKIRIAQNRPEVRRKKSLSSLGRVAWNKGLKGIIKCSEETKLKMSQSHLKIKMEFGE